MIHARICDLLGISHPIILGGMGTAVSNAAGDIDNASLSFGQDAGLIDSITSVREAVRKIIAEAEEIIKGRLQFLLT